MVREINQTQHLDVGLKRIKDLFDKAVQRRVLSDREADQRFAAVRGTTAWVGFDEVDVIVEAAIEDLDAKRGVFRELDGRTRPTTVLAMNTSSLRVGGLEEGLTHPERVGGMHFFQSRPQNAARRSECVHRNDQ